MLHQLKLQSWGSGDGFISCFPHRPESLCSDMHHPYKKFRHGWHTSITPVLGEGKSGDSSSPTGELQVQRQSLRQKWEEIDQGHQDIWCWHMASLHTHMHMTTYVHHVHVIIWRRGYKKNLTEIGILWQNRNHICLTTSPEGGHLPRAYVTRVGQGQSYGASHYPLRCYRELFSAMAHSQVLRKDPYDVLSEYNPDLSTSTASPLTKS